MQSDLIDDSRPYDIVVVGASGFTGRLVVEYLADKYPAGAPVRWAVAGRNRDKLQKVIAENCPSGDKPAIVVADSHDGDALRQLARDTRVVLTTVGPYAKYGSELVAACVESGTHYCDLAGEAQWIRRMIDEHQADAVESGAKIVNSCGFDSIPSDIGVFYLQQQAMETYGEPCEEIILLVKAIKGGASGGTFASMLNAVEEARSDSAVARILGDPYCLNPEGERQGSDSRDQNGTRYCAMARVWTAPFIMAANQYPNCPKIQCPARLRIREGISLQRGDRYRGRNRRLVEVRLDDCRPRYFHGGLLFQIYAFDDREENGAGSGPGTDPGAKGKRILRPSFVWQDEETENCCRPK